MTQGHEQTLICALCTMSFVILGTRYAAPVWLVPVQEKIDQSETLYRFAGWLLYGGSFLLGLIGTPIFRKFIPFKSYFLLTFTAMPAAYFLLYFAVLGYDTVGWFEYFGCTAMGFATGGSTSVVLGILGSLYGPTRMPIVNGMTQAAFSVGSVCGTVVFSQVSLEDYFLGASFIALLLPLFAIKVIHLKDQHELLKSSLHIENTGVKGVEENVDKDEVTTRVLLKRPQTMPIMSIIGLMFAVGTSVMTNIQPICRAFGGINVPNTTAIVLVGQLVGRCCMIFVHYAYALMLKTHPTWEKNLPNLQMIVNLWGSLIFAIFSGYLSSLKSAPPSAHIQVLLLVFGIFYGALFAGLGAVTIFIEKDSQASSKVMQLLGASAGSLTCVYNLIVPGLIASANDGEETCDHPSCFRNVAILWLVTAIITFIIISYSIWRQLINQHQQSFQKDEETISSLHPS